MGDDVRTPATDQREPSRGLVQALGFAAATALVGGSMIGSGIYVIPATLADRAGPVSLFAWLLVTLGYLCLTSVYADLSGAYPISGGLQIYAQRAFGDLAGLLTAFLYWISCVSANAAFLTAFVGYLQVFVPALGSPLLAFVVAQALLWTLTAVNVAGVRAAGSVQIITTVLKVVPLLVLSLALLAHGSVANLHPFAPRGVGALLPAASLIAWLFLGAEAVTVPAEEVRGGGRTLRRSAYAGYGLAACVYLLVAGSLALGIPGSEIAGTAHPLAHAGRRVMGRFGEVLLSVGALVSVAGVLNGWLLVTGRLPWAAARQRLAPRIFERLHSRTGVPTLGLVVSSTVPAALVLLYFSHTLLDAYNLIALASTATALVAIGGTCAAQLALMRREPERFSAGQRRRGRVTATLGILIAVLMIVGAGGRVLLLTLLVCALPLPWYLWLRHRRSARRVPD